MAGPAYQQDPDEMRYWREQASPFRFIYDAARARDAELSASGRRPIFGGLLSKESGNYGASTNEWEVDNNLGGVLAGLLAPVLKAFDAPSSAYQGLIPEQDLVQEVMGTAGLAMGGGAAIPSPSGSLRSGSLRSEIELPPAKNAAEQVAKDILEVRAAGGAENITNEMMAKADSQYMFDNTPLAMDQASRIARASEQEYAGDYYSGSNSAFSSFNENDSGIFASNAPSVADSYVDKAESIFSAETPTIYPLMVRGGADFPVVDAQGNFFTHIPSSGLPDELAMLGNSVGRKLNTDEIAAYLAEKEFDGQGNLMSRPPGVIFQDLVDPGRMRFKEYEGETDAMAQERIKDSALPSDVINVSDPSRLRSKFARFDPEFAHLSDLMAANKSASGGILSTAAADELRSSNVPRQMPSNNVLDPVDRLTPEQLAGAVPFERTSGFAEPRVGGGRAKDPALFTPFSSKKQSGVAPSDWSVSGRRLSSETEAPRLKSAEELQDAGFTDMFGFVADSTMGDTIFDRINDVELPRSVMQQGGHEFGDNIDGRGFASDDVALGTKEKAWRQAVDDGGKPIVTPMTMGTAGGDFSMHETMNLAQLIGAMSDSIDPDFVPLRGAAKNNERFLPEGMGLLSPELPAYLSNLKGGERAAFVKSLDTAPALKAGVPSVGAVRWASTAPELAGQPLLSSGFRAFEPKTGGFFNYGDNHASYNATIDRVGENMTMGELRPWYLQFPDEAYPKMVASTPKGSNMLKTEALPKDIRGFQMNPNMSQKMDNQWVDAQMTYEEILRNQGKEAADMYALDALVNRAQMSGNY